MFSSTYINDRQFLSSALYFSLCLKKLPFAYSFRPSISLPFKDFYYMTLLYHDSSTEHMYFWWSKLSTAPRIPYIYLAIHEYFCFTFPLDFIVLLSLYILNYLIKSNAKTTFSFVSTWILPKAFFLLTLDFCNIHCLLTRQHSPGKYMRTLNVSFSFFGV